MPRRSKGPRLWRRPARKGKSAVWVIKDSGKQYATGCVANPFEAQPPKAAEEALAAYIAGKHNLNRRFRDISEIDIADVLAIYHADKIEGHGSPNEFEARIGRLNSFWGGRSLSWVSTATCKEYAKVRGATATQQGWHNSSSARRDLEDLRAAINHHSAEGYHRAIVKVWLPEKPKRRERWLTRHEAAALLWTLYRYRETQTLHAGDRKARRSSPLDILCGTSRGSFSSACTPARAVPPLQRHRRSVVRAGHLSILIAEFTSDWRRAIARQISDSPLPRYQRGCWRICAAGSAAASQKHTLSNGEANRSGGSAKDFGTESHWRSSPLKAVASFLIRFGTLARRG